MRKSRQLYFSWLAAVAVAAIAQPNSSAADPFRPTGSMTAAREWHTATLLTNGQVLVTGGYTGDNPNGAYLPTAELYDPETGTWANTAGAPSQPRGWPTATLLFNGKVLVAGGATDDSQEVVTVHASAEVYDPDTGTWSATGSMNTARAVHSATMLADGRVLAAGGIGSGTDALVEAEVYDPSRGVWTRTGTLNVGRAWPEAARLPDGRILIVGGSVGGPSRDDVSLASAELYNPVTGAWSLTGSLETARHRHSATVLPNGTVLVAGGQSNNNIKLSSAELYDPASGVWARTGELTYGRKWHVAILLPSGGVLVAGGSGDDRYPAQAEIYDPATGRWTVDGALKIPRYWHTGTLLQNGKVLIAGGGVSDDPAYASAELYDAPMGRATPPTLTDAVRMPDGAFRFAFTNTPSMSFGVLGSTDLSNWTVVGIAFELWPGHYQFTDTQAANRQHRCYRVQSH